MKSLQTGMIPNDFLASGMVVGLQGFSVLTVPAGEYAYSIAIAASLISFLVFLHTLRSRTLIPTLTAIVASSAALAAEVYTMEGPFIWRFAGAFLGASVATIHLERTRTKAGISAMLFVGTVLGLGSARYVQDSVGWMAEPDYWFASSIPGGLLGWMALTIIYGARMKKALSSFIPEREK